MDGEGYLGELSDQQQEALDEFKQWMQGQELADNPWFTDTFFLRFCRARKFDLEKIKPMFIEFIEYRKQYGIDNIFETVKDKYRDQLQQYQPRGFYGVDKIGRPIGIVRSGQFQPNKIFDIVSEEYFYLIMCNHHEEILKHYFMSASYVAQMQIQQTFTIQDLSGFSVRMMTPVVYKFLNRLSKLSQDYYPELLGMLVIINAPWTFSTCWSIIKGWLDERTRSKIHIISGDPYPLLKQHIDEEQIPDFLGGKCTRRLEEDHGPWDNFEVVDGYKPGQVVGIRRKADGPSGKVVFTPNDLEALPNYLLNDPQSSVRYHEHKKAMVEQQGNFSSDIREDYHSSPGINDETAYQSMELCHTNLCEQRQSGLMIEPEKETEETQSPFEIAAPGASNQVSESSPELMPFRASQYSVSESNKDQTLQMLQDDEDGLSEPEEDEVSKSNLSGDKVEESPSSLMKCDTQIDSFQESFLSPREEITPREDQTPRQNCTPCEKYPPLEDFMIPIQDFSFSQTQDQTPCKEISPNLDYSLQGDFSPSPKPTISPRTTNRQQNKAAKSLPTQILFASQQRTILETKLQRLQFQRGLKDFEEQYVQKQQTDNENLLRMNFMMLMLIVAMMGMMFGAAAEIKYQKRFGDQQLVQ